MWKSQDIINLMGEPTPDEIKKVQLILSKSIHKAKVYTRIMNKEDLYPKEKQFSIVIIDLWDDEENSAYKLLETDELRQTIEEIRKILNVGDYLMVYNKKGDTVEI